MKKIRKTAILLITAVVIGTSLSKPATRPVTTTGNFTNTSGVGTQGDLDGIGGSVIQ